MTNHIYYFFIQNFRIKSRSRIKGHLLQGPNQDRLLMGASKAHHHQEAHSRDPLKAHHHPEAHSRVPLKAHPQQEAHSKHLLWLETHKAHHKADPRDLGKPKFCDRYDSLLSPCGCQGSKLLYISDSRM